MSKIWRVGELFQKNTEIRGTISAKYGEQGIISAKYEEQGNYASRIRKAGGLFQKIRRIDELLHQNMESRRTLLTKYGEQGILFHQNTESRGTF